MNPFLVGHTVRRRSAVVVNLNFAESGRGVCTYVPKGLVLLLMMTQPAKYNIKQLHVQPHSRVFSK
jgi:hypothetical protein